MAPLREFNLFPALPAELRLAIWRLATFEPRIIEIDKVPDCIDIIQWGSTTPAPSLLGVCHESRQEALKAYTVLEVMPTDYENSSWELTAKSLKKSLPHLSVHPEPVPFSCKTCARRMQQQAHIKWAKVRRERTKAFSHGVRSNFDFDGYLATLGSVQISDIPLNSDGVYQYEEYCIQRMLHEEAKAKAELLSTIVPFRHYISSAQDVVYLNPAVILRYEFPYFFQETGSTPQIQHIAAHIKPRVGNRSDLDDDPDEMIGGLAYWAADSPSLRRISIISENHHRGTTKPACSRGGNVIAINAPDTDATQLLPISDCKEKVQKSLPAWEAELICKFKQKFEIERAYPKKGRLPREDSLPLMVGFATVIREAEIEEV